MSSMKTNIGILLTMITLAVCCVSCTSDSDMTAIDISAPDPDEVFMEMKQKAELGDPKAQNITGNAYASGETVIKDYRQAYKWYTKAAEQGEADAQYMLSWIYGPLRGMQDRVKALKWLSIAHTAQGAYSDNIERLESMMTSEQIEEARALAIKKIAEIEKKAGWQ